MLLNSLVRDVSMRLNTQQRRSSCYSTILKISSLAQEIGATLSSTCQDINWLVGAGHAEIQIWVSSAYTPASARSGQ